MDKDSLESFCRKENISLLIDAAHPFAEELHRNVSETADILQIPVIRYERIYPRIENNEVLYEFLKDLGIMSEHNRPIDSGSYSYWPDFTFTINGKRMYLEHMGKLDDPYYHRKQVEKIRNYKTHDIRLGENLVITSSHKHFQAPRILWQLVIRGVLSATKARKLIKKNKK